MFILKSMKYFGISEGLLTCFPFSIALIASLNQSQKTLAATEPIMLNVFSLLVSCPRYDNINYSSVKEEHPFCSVV